jgi:histidinol dehydrogenase
MPAGPSELLVADDAAVPAFVASIYYHKQNMERIVK